MRIGIGYDIHRIADGGPLVLGGIEIPFIKKLEGHSDADVMLHAICDSILGAIGEGDIGKHFPDTDPAYKGASSKEFLKKVKALMDKKGFGIVNLDCILIAELPKIGPYRDSIAGEISGILDVPKNTINVKGKTNEKLGDIGEGRAMAAYATVLLREL